MMDIGSRLFVHIAVDPKRRILHPAKILDPATILEEKPDLYTAELQDEQLSVDEGQEILIFFLRGHEFLQQAATIDKVIEREPYLVIEFEMIGKPVSAESRQEYRVSTHGADMSVEIGDENDCQLLDIGCGGFSAAASEQYEIGNILNATLKYEDQEYTGSVSVQSIRAMRDGRTRYGLSCVENAGDANSLAKELPKVFMSLQRAQLRRLARTC